MSRAVLIATIALLLDSTVAEAQRSDKMARPGPGAGQGGGRPPGQGGGGPQIQPPRPGRPEVKPTPGHGGGQHRPPHNNRPPSHGRPPNYGKPPHHGRPPHYRPPSHYRPPPGYWHGSSWGRPPIHRPHFYYPHGYAYRRWTTGLLLPAVFLSTAYYFTDYHLVGLYAAPYGYHWVRYGPDLLLVETGTRRIVEVRYGVFR